MDRGSERNEKLALVSKISPARSTRSGRCFLSSIIIVIKPLLNIFARIHVKPSCERGSRKVKQEGDIQDPNRQGESCDNPSRVAPMHSKYPFVTCPCHTPACLSRSHARKLKKPSKVRGRDARKITVPSIFLCVRASCPPVFHRAVKMQHVVCMATQCVLPIACVI